MIGVSSTSLFVFFANATATTELDAAHTTLPLPDALPICEVYAGMYAIATLRPFVYDVNGNRGVSFGLQNIQILRDGEPLDGRMRPEQEFEAVEQDDVFDDEDDDDDDPDDDLPI